MLKKNSGVKMSATGFIPFSIISNWFVPDRMIPAANAPMMRADPARAARAARSSRKANAETRSTPRTRIRFTNPKMRGASAVPSATAATRNPTATASVRTTPSALTAAPAASPETTPRITRPSTSSITAAPRMSRASVESMRFRSESTRAGIPTDVAQHARPEHDASDKLAQHCRLPQPLDQPAGELAREKHQPEHGEEPHDVAAAARRAEQERRQGSPEPRATTAA